MTVVSGQVLDHAGHGVPGVFVTAVPVGGRRFSVRPSTHTDLSGRWGLDLAPGVWTVRETGHGWTEITVGDAPVKLGEQPVAESAPLPSADDIERLYQRMKSARVEAPVEPLIEPDPLPVTRNGDVGAFLRARRAE